VRIILLAFCSMLLILLTALPGRSEPISCSLFKGNHQVRQNRDGAVLRVFRFTFEAQLYTAVFLVDVEYLNTLAQYGQRDRANLALMAEVAGLECKPVSHAIREFLGRGGPGIGKAAGFCLALSQSLPYTTDASSLGADEFYRTPAETIVDTGIDCEDSSLLLGGLLDGLGIGYVFLTPPGHIAVGIQGNFSGWHVPVGNRRFYFAETTGTGFRIGDLPSGISPEMGLMDVSGNRERILPVQLVNSGGDQPSTIPPEKRQVTKRDKIPSSSEFGWTIAILLTFVIGMLLLWVGRRLSNEPLSDLSEATNEPPESSSEDVDLNRELRDKL
jgi:hypothetical protein